MVGKTALNKERYHLNGGPFQTLEREGGVFPLPSQKVM